MRVVHVLDEVAGLGLVRDGALTVGDERLHLHERVHGQRRNSHNRAGRKIRGEEGAVHLVDHVHVADVAHEDGDPRDVVQRVVDALDDGLEVLEALLGLLEDAALDDGAGLRVDGELSRDVVVVRERHGLRKTVVLRGLVRVTSQYYVISH